MKRILHFLAIVVGTLIVSILTSSLALAQETTETEKRPFTDGISITAAGGVNHFWGDLRNYKYWPVWENQNENQPGFGIAAHKEIYKYFGVGFKLNGGWLQGTDRDRSEYLQLYFRANIIEASLDANFDVFEFAMRKKENYKCRFSALLTLSHGIAHFDSQAYKKVDGEWIEYLDPAKRGHSYNTNEAVTSYGLWLRYQIASNWIIGYETSVRNVWNDRLDGFESAGSSNDKYSFSALNITYTFGENECMKKPEKEEEEPVAEVVEVEKIEEEPFEVEEETIEDEPIEMEEELDETAVVEAPVEVEPEPEPTPEPEPVVEEVKPEPAKVNKVDFSDNVIYFALNAYSSADPAQQQVKAIAQKLKDNPGVKIKLTGYTDKSGDASYNALVSKRRAEAIKKMLVDIHKIDASRIETEGKGSEGATKNWEPARRKVVAVQVN